MKISLYSEFSFYNLIVQIFSKHIFEKYCLYCENNFDKMGYETSKEAINWGLYEEYCRFLIGDSNKDICIYPHVGIYIEEKDVHLRNSELLKAMGLNKLVPNIATAGFLWDEGLQIDMVCEPTIRTPTGFQLGNLTTKEVKSNIGRFNDDVMHYWEAWGRSSATYISEGPIDELDLSELEIQLLDISPVFLREDNYSITNKITYKDSVLVLDDFRSWGFQNAEAGWMIKKEGTVTVLETIDGL